MNGVLRVALVAALVAGSGLVAQQGTHGTASRASSPQSLFSGPAEAVRRAEIDAAIQVLRDHAKQFPSGSARRADLESAAAGLARMAKADRFRLFVEEDSDGGLDTAARCETPTDKDKPADGGPIPGSGKKRCAEEDSFIDFPQEHWQEDPASPGGAPTPSGWQRGHGGTVPEELAIILWHEWGHAQDPGFASDCDDVKRHICILKGQIKLAKSLEEPPGVAENERPKRLRGFGFTSERAAQGQLEALMEECQGLQPQCPDCGACPVSDAWG